jgi:hypothetical protein
MKEILTLKKLYSSAKEFCKMANKLDYPELLGVSDGKAIGTFVEQEFKKYLSLTFEFNTGNVSYGIDLPDDHINTDIKVTSCRQPQSSCPYSGARQKIFGLGYNLLVLVYDKKDLNNIAKLNFLNCTFISKERTGDFITTKHLREMLKDGASKEDIIAYFININLPAEEITLDLLADEVMHNKIVQGYLTISNALQWRLQYQRVISLENKISGVNNYAC